MFERFTEAARAIVVQAQEARADLGHPFVGTEHLLLAMMSDDGVAGRILATRPAESSEALDAERVRAEIERRAGAGQSLLGERDAEALRSVGIDLDAVLARIEQTFGPDALSRNESCRGWFGRRARAGRFSARAKKVLELSLREALRLKSNHIRSGHLLLGLLREGEGLGARILVDAGHDLDALRAMADRMLRDVA